MTDNNLNAMADCLENYLKDTGISQNKIASDWEVSSSYLSHALKRNWNEVPAGKNGDGSPRFTRFSDNIAKKIMKGLGLTIETNWEIANYMVITNILIEAKKHKEHRIIDGTVGSGKTFTAEAFKRQYPQETYLITCSEDMNPKALSIEMANLIGVDSTGDRRKIRLRIGAKLQSQNNALIIIDECENMKPAAFGFIKALYDNHKDDVGIVLIGANGFLEKIKKYAMAGKGCFPQIYSRFSAEPGILQTISKADVKHVCALNGITDKDVINSLFDTCNDYRELDRNIKRHLRDGELR